MKCSTRNTMDVMQIDPSKLMEIVSFSDQDTEICFSDSCFSHDEFPGTSFEDAYIAFHSTTTIMHPSIPHKSVEVGINVLATSDGSVFTQLIFPSGYGVNPPTAGSDSSMVMQYRFDGLGASGILRGWDYQSHAPINDAPTAGKFDWGKLLTFVAAGVILAVAVAAIVFTGGAALGIAAVKVTSMAVGAAVGGIAATVCVAIGDVASGNVSNLDYYLLKAFGGAISGAVSGMFNPTSLLGFGGVGAFGAGVGTAVEWGVNKVLGLGYQYTGKNLVYSMAGGFIGGMASYGFTKVFGNLADDTARNMGENLSQQQLKRLARDSVGNNVSNNELSRRLSDILKQPALKDASINAFKDPIRADLLGKNYLLQATSPSWYLKLVGIHAVREGVASEVATALSSDEVEEKVDQIFDLFSQPSNQSTPLGASGY